MSNLQVARQSGAVVLTPPSTTKIARQRAAVVLTPPSTVKVIRQSAAVVLVPSENSGYTRRRFSNVRHVYAPIPYPLILNGFAEHDMTGWELNPNRPYITVDGVYDEVIPSQGTTQFKWGRDWDSYDNIWMQQTVPNSRIVSVYGSNYSFDSKVINLSWTQGRHSVRNYGLTVTITQYAEGGAILGTTTNSYYTAGEDLVEPKTLTAAVLPNFSYFSVKFLGIYEETFMWIGVDQIKATFEEQV